MHKHIYHKTKLISMTICQKYVDYSKSHQIKEYFVSDRYRCMKLVYVNTMSVLYIITLPHKEWQGHHNSIKTNYCGPFCKYYINIQLH